MAVSVLLEIEFGHAQTSAPKIGILKSPVNAIQDDLFWGCSRVVKGGGQKDPPP